MEERSQDQIKSIVRRNFYDVITQTKFTPNFLETFKRQGVVNDEDIQVVPPCLTDKLPAMERACQFYKMIMNGDQKLFEILLKSLRKTGQSEVYKILSSEDGLSTSGKEMDYIPIGKLSRLVDYIRSVRNFKSPPLDVIRLLASDSKKILVLCCQNLEVTSKWILETLKNVKVIQSNLPSEEIEILIDNDSIGLVKLEDTNFRNLSKTLRRLPRNRGKFLVLYGDKRTPTFLDQTLVTGSADLDVGNLTEAYKEHLLKKISEDCCLPPRLIDPGSPVFSCPSTFNTLIAQDEEKKEKGLLVSVVENYLDETAPEIDLEDKLLVKTLAEIALKQQFPSWEKTVFGKKSQNEMSRVKNVRQILVTKGVLKRSSTSELEFTDSCVGSYFLGKYIGEEKVNIAAFNKVLLKLAETFAGFENELCVYFLDHFIGRELLSVDGGAGVYTLHFCVHDNRTNLLISISGGKITFAGTKLLLAAVTCGRMDTLEETLKAYEKDGRKIHEMQNGFEEGSLFHLAVHRCNFDFVSKLWNEYGFKGVIGKEHMRNIVRTCVAYTMCSSKHEINERKRILEMLLKADRSLLDKGATAADKYGVPLLYCHVHLELIKFLVSYGAEANVTNGDGRTLAHQSLLRDGEQYHELVKYFLESGQSQLLKSRDKYGCNPLHVAVIDGVDGKMQEKTLQLFLIAGLDLNEKNSNGESVITLAVRRGVDKNFLKFLVESGADWKRDEKEILRNALSQENIEALEYFVSLGAGINAKLDSSGKTPLHLALEPGYAKNRHAMVECLLKLGASVNLKDDSGKTPLFYAENAEHVEMETIELLKTY